LVGTPAIAYVPSWPALLFQVVARMRVNNQIKLYETYFDGSNFVSVLGSGPGTWAELPVNSRSVDSDPALEYTPALGYTTLYWRSGPEMIQTSGFVTSTPLGSLPERIIDPLNDPYFGIASPGSATGSGPGVMGGMRLEFGSHIVVARTTDNRLWHFESGDDQYLIP
jgi:hypothetical protein